MDAAQTATAHQQLLTLGLEVLGILALATVAAQPNWGAPAVVLLLLLWGLFLLAHSDALVGALGGVPGPPKGPETSKAV